MSSKSKLGKVNTRASDLARVSSPGKMAKAIKDLEIAVSESSPSPGATSVYVESKVANVVNNWPLEKLDNLHNKRSINEKEI